jgi:hypothetical protein
VHTGVWYENLRKREYLEDQGVDGTIILKWIFYKYDWSVDWIGLVQERDRLPALVNAVMNLRVP